MGPLWMEQTPNDIETEVTISLVFAGRKVKNENGQ